GDYHSNNIIVTDNDLYVIDWTGISLNDMRFDLGFAIVSLEAFSNEKYISSVIKLYEDKSGLEVNSIEYFMILSSLHNMIKIYSCAFDYGIADENDETRDLFLFRLRNYPLYLMELYRKVAGIELPSLIEFFNRNKSVLSS
ncbi:MAG: phosphotransferase, partial [Candidatus Heimdallarchaeota archaeon]|nr:phosphotransferase [Candidatus Heimdallarchaeota archaeon]